MHLDHPIFIYTMINSVNWGTVIILTLEVSILGITPLFLCMYSCNSKKILHTKSKIQAFLKYFLIHHFGNPMNESHWSQGVVYTLYHLAGEIILESV